MMIKKFLLTVLQKYLYSRNIKESCGNLPYLNSIKLADSETDNKNLAREILGVNFYWDIVLEGFLN